jgi:CRISPR-associated protein Csx14
MADASIPVDLFNPGQVLACLGFVEAAELILGEAEGAFDWSNPLETRFHVRARGPRSPVTTVLEFLAHAEAYGEVPEGSANAQEWKAAWGSIRTRSRDRGYPVPDPDSPATVVCVLSDGVHELRLDYWGDAAGRDNVKFWAGAAGYPGVALTRDALDLVRECAAASASDPFALGVPQSSSFRLDWRRDYIPIDAGFSLNAHAGRIEAVGYPLVELLAAVGLTNARPRRPNRRDKLEYVYGVVGTDSSSALWLPLPVLRAAMGSTALPFATRRFRMQLGWPGKEGQARAITTVTEEIDA